MVEIRAGQTSGLRICFFALSELWGPPTQSGHYSPQYSINLPVRYLYVDRSTNLDLILQIKYSNITPETFHDLVQVLLVDYNLLSVTLVYIMPTCPSSCILTTILQGR